MKVFKFSSNHILYEKFNSKLKQLIESGIVQRWVDYFYRRKYDLEGSGPSVLTLDDLEVGFQVWFCFVLLSASVFLMEILIFYQREIVDLMQLLRTYLIMRFIILGLGKTSLISR